MHRLASAKPTAPTSAEPRSVARPGSVRALPFAGDDDALIEGLRARQPMAIAALCERHSRWVLQLLGRVLGADPDLADLHHEVFVRAIRAAHTIRDPAAIRGWVATIAVNVARSRLKARARHRCVVLGTDALVDAAEAVAPSAEHRQALQHAYALLEQLPREERIAFTLRVIEGMKLGEVAEAADVSLATVKRRLVRAERRFRELAAADPVLRPWLDGADS